jgi:hypothetical protein
LCKHFESKHLHKTLLHKETCLSQPQVLVPPRAITPPADTVYIDSRGAMHFVMGKVVGAGKVVARKHGPVEQQRITAPVGWQGPYRTSCNHGVAATNSTEARRSSSSTAVRRGPGADVACSHDAGSVSGGSRRRSAKTRGPVPCPMPCLIPPSSSVGPPVDSLPQERVKREVWSEAYEDSAFA